MPVPNKPARATRPLRRVRSRSAPKSTVCRTKSSMSKRVSIKISVADTIRKCHASEEDDFSKHYMLGEEIYSSEWCRVHTCTHRTTGVERVAKIVREMSIHSRCNEFETVKQLDHPNIVKVFELFHQGTEYFIIMERLRGGSFSDALAKRNGELSVSEVKVVVNRLLSCLVHLQANKVVHCGIGPSNIMLARPGDLSSITLLGFDAAVTLKSGQKVCFDQQCQEIHYQSPELLHDFPEYDYATDVWSCGVMLYRSLFQRFPFEADSSADLKSAIRAGVVKFPKKEGSTTPVPYACTDLILDLLTVDPASRPTARQALLSKWLTATDDNTEMNSDQNTTIDKGPSLDTIYILSNVRKFEASTKLKQAACALIAAHLLTKDETRSIEGVFNSMDIRRVGKIRQEELRAAYLMAFGTMISPKEVQEIFHHVDYNGSGSIDFSEFAVAATLSSSLLDKKRLKQAFDMFDINKDGYISRDELREMFSTRSSPEQQEKYLDKVISQVDINHDGKISFDEFERMMKTSPFDKK